MNNLSVTRFASAHARLAIWSCAVAFVLGAAAAAGTGSPARPGTDRVLAAAMQPPTGPMTSATRKAQSNYCDACYSDCGSAGPECPDPTGTPDDWITNVTYAGINNNSFAEGCPCSYGDYTELAAFVTVGGTNTLSVSFCSEGTWTDCVLVWIDWNHTKSYGGPFEPDELYYLGCGVDGTFSMDITTPTYAEPGSTIMRVGLEAEVYPWNLCPDDGVYGEVEDYTVAVVDENSCCIDHDLPGCIEPDCEVAVCSYDPYCCDNEWDEICADEAQDDVSCTCGLNGCYPGDEQPNNTCESATPVTGPYPQAVSGDNTCATLDCPGVLDWNATWWAIDLPYPWNDLYVDYCYTQPGVYFGGAVIYNDCADCDAYIVADNSGFQCPETNLELSWFGLPGPTTMMFPAYYVDSNWVAIPYTLRINVLEADSGVCGDCPTDVDGNGNTDAFDLANLLGAWGSCDSGELCECLDADDDGTIGAFDLAVLLGAWGPCG